ncbi:hypothetical protein FGO68_gene12122 [Halteria grandinella]|uniref:Uncharacterized protein n=1 Tax=Halteria grandinella TaxID=5974 RepID=A0A8J8P458_HALGN|nr:hypothetical protein FGO68_gene12122 [Halteria grandinella]
MLARKFAIRNCERMVLSMNYRPLNTAHAKIKSFSDPASAAEFLIPRDQGCFDDDVIMSNKEDEDIFVDEDSQQYQILSGVAPSTTMKAKEHEDITLQALLSNSQNQPSYTTTCSGDPGSNISIPQNQSHSVQLKYLMNEGSSEKSQTPKQKPTKKLASRSAQPRKTQKKGKATTPKVCLPNSQQERERIEKVMEQQEKFLSKVAPHQLMLSDENISKLPPIPMMDRSQRQDQQQTSQSGGLSEQELNCEAFLQYLNQITAGEGDSRHLANTGNASRMAELIRKYDDLMHQKLEPMRMVIVKVLIKTMNEVILKKFLDSKGLECLSKWLDPVIADLEGIQSLQFNYFFRFLLKILEQAIRRQLAD